MALSQSINVSLARKKYGIDYPALYAGKEHINPKGKCKDEKDMLAYNCVQRAHQHPEHILREQQRRPGLLAAHVALFDRVEEAPEGPRIALGESLIGLVKQKRGRERREARHDGGEARYATTRGPVTPSFCKRSPRENETALD